MGPSELLPSTLAIELMEKAELHHARSPFSKGVIGSLITRTFFIFSGASVAVETMAFWLAAVGALALLVFGLQIAESAQQKTQIFQALVILITAVFALPPPSRLTLLHVNPVDVGGVAGRCNLLQSASVSDLDACDRILAMAEKICARRIAVLWFFPATGWAVAAYLLQRALQSKNPDLAPVLVVGLITMLLALTVAAYSRSVWTVLGLSFSTVNFNGSGSFNDNRIPWLRLRIWMFRNT